MTTRHGHLPLRCFYAALFGHLGAYVPFFPTWLDEHGFRGISLGILFAVTPVLAIVAPPSLGIVADVLRLRGKLLQLACTGALTAALGLLLVTWFGQVGFALILSCVVGLSLCRAPMMVMADVIAMESGLAYGRLRLWGSIGFAVSCLGLGVAFDREMTLSLPVALSALLALTWLLSFAVPSNTDLPRVPVLSEVRRLLRRPSWLVFLGVSFLGFAAHSGYDLCISLHLRDLGGGKAIAGLAWTVGVAVEVGFLFASEALLRRFAPTTLLAAGFLAAIARWLLLAELTRIEWLIASQALHGVTFGVVWASSVRLVKQHGGQVLASAQGVFVAVVNLGRALGMLIWGPLYERAGGPAVFHAAAVISGLALCVMLVGRRVFVGSSDLRDAL